MIELIKKHFPYEEIISAYGYGSNIIPQYNIAKGKMTDLIFVVKDLEDFHIANKKMNREHYSFIDKIINKSKFINDLGTKVYYHQGIKVGNTILKYGIVSQRNFECLLKNWNNLFLCGRFHKPIQTIISNKKNDELIEENRKKAFGLVALKSKPSIRKEKFYEDIIKVSYIGDIRNLLKLEDKKKSEKMLKGAYDLYDKIYSKFAVSSSKAKLILNQDLKVYYNILPKKIISALPANFLSLSLEKRGAIINRFLRLSNLESSFESLLMGLYSSPDITYIIEKYKKKIL